MAVPRWKADDEFQSLVVAILRSLPLLSISVSKWDWWSSRNQSVTGNESRCVFGFD